MELTKKIAVICGGAGGIGKAVTLRLAEAGFFPVILDKDEPAGAEALQSLRSQDRQGRFIALELTKKAEVQKAFSDCISQYGRVDVLVNLTGGIVYPKLIQDFSFQEWREVIDLNVKSAFLSCQAVIQTMKQQRQGSIINTSSNLGFTGAVTRTAYSAGKAAVVAFTKSLALELAPYGIRANTITPGLTATPRSMGDFSPERLARASALIPMGRPAQPDEIAEGVAFLASEESHFMTGQTLHVNGGMVLP